MTELHSLETAISMKHRPAFMINLNISHKCNLECSYCDSHDNSFEPVPFDQCIKSVDFILQYVDIIMSLKQKHSKRAALNFIGGEPFTHPDIDKILEYIRNEHKTKYQDSWSLSVCVTTNGLAGPKLLERCIGLVDMWTVSYHTETLKKQKELTLSNIRKLHNSNQFVEVRVMSHPENEKFLEAKEVHSTLISEGINALMKPITSVMYKEAESSYFKIFWKTKEKDQIENYSTSQGITCCSERPMVLNGDRSTNTNFIPMNNFKGWHCAVNLDFLYVNYNGNVLHNSSCKVSYLTGKLGPIGTIDNYEAILDELRNKVAERSLPVIVCPKELCISCGMCSTKAETAEEFKKIMSTRLNDVSLLKFEK